MEDALAGSAWDTPLCVSHSGFNLHANTVVEASDRDRLEQLCRYIQRPVIAQDRLAELEDGRFYYEFKRVWKNGTRGIFFEGPDLLERLTAPSSAQASSTLSRRVCALLSFPSCCEADDVRW